MARLQAKKISGALKKAQRVGEVEESFSIDGCEVVLRSLRKPEIEAATAVANELEDLAFINAFKLERLSRSIIELNGESLREFDFVEVELEEVDPDSGKAKVVALERYQFIKDCVLSTWSEEAIDTAYRKYTDLTAKAERKAVEGVTFTVPEETPEEIYRRLLKEAKELEGQLPIELVSRILEEVGYMAKTSREELEAADSRLAQVETEVAPSEASVAPTEGSGASLATTPALDPRRLIAARVPLNRQAVSVPQTEDPSRGALPPPELQARPVLPAPPAALKRSAELEALETGAGLSIADLPAGAVPAAAPGTAISGSTSVATMVPEQLQPTKVDPQAAERILDKPPVAGINPRYRRPPGI